jgi:hypothetical protein
MYVDEKELRGDISILRNESSQPGDIGNVLVSQLGED